MDEALFWADRIAKKIIERERYHYLDKPVPKFDEFVVKSSASLSGVLHIGRLSDTIRGESVHRALLDFGYKSKFIWVAEDMDPLRKIPKGINLDESYIGCPVSAIPDPYGCHDSYAQHHLDAYMQVLHEFVSLEFKTFSMAEEYRKGTFNDAIKKILQKIQQVKDILNSFRTTPLEEGWSPWTPVCKNCGKIITPRVRIEDGRFFYKCVDYKFAKTIAKGCGYEGEAKPGKDLGKLVWKSEWASQWAVWNVCCEGAGKEYQVPNSAWWVNAKICELILDWPAPEPIFYEHIMIDGKKMSASLGNVVYPAEWLEVADPEILRFFYNKKLMKTRSFSWSYLPNLYDDYDRHASVYFGEMEIENEKERKHMQRLFEITQLGKPVNYPKVPYSFAAVIGQIAKDEKMIFEILKRTGHLKGEIGEDAKNVLLKRIERAAKWVEKYAPEKRIEIKESPDKKVIESLDEKQKEALLLLLLALKEPLDEKQLYNKFWEIAEDVGIPASKFFEACYLVLLGKTRGPRLSTLILSIGKEKVAKIIKNIKEF